MVTFGGTGSLIVGGLGRVDHMPAGVSSCNLLLWLVIQVGVFEQHWPSGPAMMKIVCC